MSGWPLAFAIVGVAWPVTILVAAVAFVWLAGKR